jgi:hypothetical protein
MRKRLQRSSNCSAQRSEKGWKESGTVIARAPSGGDEVPPDRGPRTTQARASGKRKIGFAEAGRASPVAGSLAPKDAVGALTPYTASGVPHHAFDERHASPRVLLPAGATPERLLPSRNMKRRSEKHLRYAERITLEWSEYAPSVPAALKQWAGG